MQNILEIQDIKYQNLICLDFDDCIIEWDKRKDLNVVIENLKNNVNIIKEFCEKNNYNIFITSSWCKIINDDLTLKSNELLFNDMWNIIKLLPIIGKDPFNNREVAMDVLLDNSNKIICIDDLDLEPHFEYSKNFTMLNVVNGKNLEKLKEIK